MRSFSVSEIAEVVMLDKRIVDMENPISAGELVVPQRDPRVDYVPTMQFVQFGKIEHLLSLCTNFR